MELSRSAAEGAPAREEDARIVELVDAGVARAGEEVARVGDENVSAPVDRYALRVAKAGAPRRQEGAAGSYEIPDGAPARIAVREGGSRGDAATQRAQCRCRARVFDRMAFCEALLRPDVSRLAAHLPTGARAKDLGARGRAQAVAGIVAEQCGDAGVHGGVDRRGRTPATALGLADGHIRPALRLAKAGRIHAGGCLLRVGIAAHLRGDLSASRSQLRSGAFLDGGRCGTLDRERKQRDQSDSCAR